jgi:hypothetical protein
MSKKDRGHAGDNKGMIRWILMVAVLAVIAGSVYFLTRSDKITVSPDTSSLQEKERSAAIAESKSMEAEGEMPKSVTRAVKVKVNMDTLQGQWFRTDGEYMIEVSSVSDNGEVKAAYFNPRPIKVSKSEAYPEHPPRLFVELQDAGYDGSSYSLSYDSQHDVLRGTYFQATYGQTYQVIFMRGTRQ